MKRKLLVIGEMRNMMKDTFGINDKEIDQVIEFMGEDYDRMYDVIKIAAKSDDLTFRQKMVVSYIVGNTSGMLHAKDIENISRLNEIDSDNSPICM